MKQITITVSVDGNEVTRNYAEEMVTDNFDWSARVWDMLQTIKNSDKGNF